MGFGKGNRVGVILLGLLLATSPAWVPKSPASANNMLSARTFYHISKQVTTSPTGYSPAAIRSFYNLPSTGGSGTIALIDAYDSPNAQSDLATFSSQFGLPAANFEKHMMASGIQTNSGWGLEIALDVQWAHAIAPNSKILLVEATSSSLDISSQPSTTLGFDPTS